MKSVIDTIYVNGYEQVKSCTNPDIGLKAYLAVHNTKFGPATGGCRIKQYISDKDALQDTLKLAKAMTYKNTIADIPYGGGKLVIVANDLSLSHITNYSPEFYRNVGDFINSLKGSFLVGMDMGMTDNYFKILAGRTIHTYGFDQDTQTLFNPSEATAYGVYEAIKRISSAFLGKSLLDNMVFNLQGLGSVGSKVFKHLMYNGTNLHINISENDTNNCYISRNSLPLTLVNNNTSSINREIETYEDKCDFFIPCATGNILRKDNVDKIKAKFICGAANNQLEDETISYSLLQRDILYAPDYVVNAGGTIYASMKQEGKSNFECAVKINKHIDFLVEILKDSKMQMIPPNFIANEIVNKKLGGNA